MKLYDLQLLPLANGDIIKIPKDTDAATRQQIRDALVLLHSGERTLIFTDDISKIPDDVMADAGWVRQDTTPK